MFRSLQTGGGGGSSEVVTVNPSGITMIPKAESDANDQALQNAINDKQTALLEIDPNATTNNYEYYSTAATTALVNSTVSDFKNSITFEGENALVVGDLNTGNVKITVNLADADNLGLAKILTDLGNENIANATASIAAINAGLSALKSEIEGGVIDAHNTLHKISEIITAHTNILTTSNAALDTVDELQVGLTNHITNTYNKQEVDDKDTAAKNRDNHTGTQAISTIENLQSTLDNLASTLASSLTTADFGDSLAQAIDGIVPIQRISDNAHNVQALADAQARQDLVNNDAVNKNALYYLNDDETKTLYIWNDFINNFQILGASSSGGTIALAVVNHTANQLEIYVPNSSNLVIPAASPDKAGLLTAGDYNKLAALPTNNELTLTLADYLLRNEANLPNGWLQLGFDGKINSSAIKNDVVKVFDYLNLESLQSAGQGVTGYLYLVTQGNDRGLYQWDGVALEYVLCDPRPDLSPFFDRTTQTLDDITAGADNLHYTSQIHDRLANTSDTNTGDETKDSIQTKRPLKTINNKSTEGIGNVELTTDDINTVADKRYITDAALNKLSGIENNAEVNLQSNWNVTDTTSKAYILNKPSILSEANRYICGQLIFHISDTVSGCLKFDGVSLYNKTTYAELYALIQTLVDGDYTDGDNFYLPDATGRVIGVAGSGAGLTARNLFDIFGEETHRLAVDELAAHSHKYDKYYHDSQLVGSQGYFDSGAAVPNDNRQYASVDSDGSGGNQPHNNMQPTLFAAQNLFIAY